MIWCEINTSMSKVNVTGYPTPCADLIHDLTWVIGVGGWVHAC